jgi:hypothetical protein
MKPGRALLGMALFWCALATASSSCDEEGPGLTGSTQTSPSGPGAGASGSSGNTGGAPPAPTTREDYCDQIQIACTGENLQYASDATCMNVALKIPEGNAAAPPGNTIACRGVYVSQAAGDPAGNCRAAGPASDDDKCGTLCDNFCWLASTLCTGDDEQWADVTSCRQDCALFAAKPYVSPTETGDNFACRMYWLTQAANDPDGNCKKIALDSEDPYSDEGVCVDPEPPPDGGMGGGGGLGGLGGGGGGGGGPGDGGPGDGGPDAGMGGQGGN